MKRLKTLTTLAAMAMLFTTSSAHASDLDDVPLDVAIMSAELLAEEVEDAQFSGEALILSQRNDEARKVYEKIQEKLVKRGDLLTHLLNHAPNKKVMQFAVAQLRHNAMWMARTNRTLRTLSMPLAQTD